MISPEDIRWRGGDASPVTGACCPVCGDVAPRTAILDVPSMAPPYTALTLLRCPACSSGHFEPPGIASFADLGQNREDFWRFYVEVGGGVWETLWPILAVAGAPSQATLLDVGCGFGFAVDGWSRLGRGEAIGVELADYGQVGARLLGITVHDQLLDDCAPLAGRQFDIVYASEVIEHVPDPGAFVATLARYVAPDGVLVLTTPSMAFVTPAEHSSTLHAALAPGFHGFLLSAEAFADTAIRGGFAHVDVRNFGERQILWASRIPLRVDTGAPRMFPDYLRYLESRVATDDPSSPVWQGLAYRLVKEWSNTGHAQRAHALAQRLMAAIVSTFGADVAEPERVAARLRACADLAEVGKAMPYFLPNLYFHLGNLASLVERDGARARRMYAGTVACTLEVCRFGSIFFLEAISLVWPARAALADLLLRAAAVCRRCHGVRAHCRGRRPRPCRGRACARGTRRCSKCACRRWPSTCGDRARAPRPGRSSTATASTCAAAMATRGSLRPAWTLRWREMSVLCRWIRCSRPGSPRCSH